MGRKVLEKTKEKLGLPRITTGIQGLDELLGGGLPKARATLLSGSTGTGKTVFLNSFLHSGIQKFGENGVFVTLEESPVDISANVLGFGWDYEGLIREGKLAFVDGSPSDDLIESGGYYDLSPLMRRVEHAVKKVGATRVAIDGLDGLFTRFSNKDAVRSVLNSITSHLKAIGVTSLIAGERQETSDNLTRYGSLEFVSDGVIELDLIRGQQQSIRKASVRKLRGCSYRSGVVEYEISAKGVEIFPKIEVATLVAKTDFSVRRKFGILQLDRMLGGGIPQGHMVLLTGNTGTGKTTFGLQFMVEGLRMGERAVFVALEESVSQVKKTALEHGWDFEKAELAGELGFVAAKLIDISPDRLLYEIVNQVERIDAKRIVLDSVSSLMSATMNEEQVRQFLIQLSAYLKSRGVTAVLNYLCSANFGAVKGQLLSNVETNEMRLSSIADGLVMLLYVERGQCVRKLMNVLKLRGSQHSKEVYRYEIKRGKVVVQGKYEE
jgi:circadian clock protein KaiC